MKERSRHAVSFAFFAALVSAALHAEPGYRYVVGKANVADLGTLGGGQSWAYDINNAGHVVGMSETAASERHAFFFRADGFKIDIGSAFGNSASQALAINASNAVVGWYRRDPEEHAFRWTSAGVVTLADGTPSGDAGGAEAHGISNSGLIAGVRWFSDGRPSQPTVWTDEFTHYLIGGTVGGSASDINDSGLVVGAVGTRLAAWQTYLPFSEPLTVPLPAYCAGVPLYSSRMNAVNRWGVMVGYADCRPTTGGRTDHALLWTGLDDYPLDLGLYPGANTSEATDINDSGFIVGTANASGGIYGFIYHHDFGYFVLPRLPTEPGGAGCEAQALNNLNKNGMVQVVGWCRTFGSRFHAVRWNVTIETRSTTP